MDYKVYSLKEPDSDIVRYIGYTGKSLKVRLRGHLNCLISKSKKNSWIISLKNKNTSPTIELIEDGLTKEEALNKEVFYIKLFKSFGANLVNGTTGGDVGTELSAEARKKVSEANKGRRPSKETIEKIRAKNIGQKRTQEFKDSLSIKLKGKKRTDAYRKNLSEKLKGRKQSPESIAKRVEKLKGRPGYWTGKKMPSEVRDKMSKSRMGHSHGFKKGVAPWNKGTKGVCVAWNAGTSKRVKKVHSEENQKIMALNKANGKPWNCGIKRGPASKETKDKMSKAHKGKVVSSETCKKLSQLAKSREFNFGRRMPKSNNASLVESQESKS